MFYLVYFHVTNEYQFTFFRPVNVDTRQCFMKVVERCTRDAFDCIVNAFYVKKRDEATLRMC